MRFYNYMLCDVTETHRNKNLPYSIRMYWTNFWQPTVHVEQNIFEKTPIKVNSSHHYASFGTFCVQISKFFKEEWAFEECLKSLFSKENVVDFEFIWKLKDSLCIRVFYLECVFLMACMAVYIELFFVLFFQRHKWSGIAICSKAIKIIVNFSRIYLRLRDIFFSFFRYCRLYI